MSETIDPGAEKFSEENQPGEGGDRLQNEGAPVINKFRDGLLLLAGDEIARQKTYYYRAQKDYQQKREQWAEILFRHMLRTG